MMATSGRTRNVLLVLGLLTACDEASAPPPTQTATATAPLVRRSTATLRDTSTKERLVFANPKAIEALMPSPERRARLLQRRHNVWAQRSNVATEIAMPATGGTADMTRGTALVRALEQLPPERRKFGLAGMTANELFGGVNGPLCEAARVEMTFIENGQRYEASYEAEQYTVQTVPTPMLYALSSTCTAALANSGGNVAAAVGAGCEPEDEAAHFEAGSDCRQCLEVDGNHARCVTAGECRAQMNREVGIMVGGSVQYFDALESVALGCAPNITTEWLTLAYELGPDNEPIAPFDHEAVFRLCDWFWNEATGAPAPDCSQTRDPIRLAVGDVQLTRVHYIRRPGDTDTPYNHRLAITSSIEIDGMVFDAMPLFPAIGEISELDNSVGWGFAPSALRPDGRNPRNIDETYAREWVAAIAVKTATRINGVPIGFANRNVCTDDLWMGPDSKGRYFCRQRFFEEDNLPPEIDRWTYDWGRYIWSIEPLRMELIPIATLLGTGLMDESIPGGHVPRVLGSPTLADPDWENCAWPEMFQPDHMATHDTDLSGTYTYTTQTYRFGKDPKVDARVVLFTSWRRDFCFQALDD